jgi:hypothetical protein
MDQMHKVKKFSKVFRRIKICIRQFDMPIKDVKDGDGYSSLWTKWDDGQYVNDMLIVYHRDANTVSIHSYYNQVSESKRSEAVRSLGRLNEKLQKTHFTIDGDNGRIFCYAALSVKGNTLGKKRFRRMLLDILKCVFLYSDCIAELTGQEGTGTDPVEGHPVEVNGYAESIAV